MTTKIQWNKVTWYSKLLAVILFVATFYVGFSLGQKKASIPKQETETPKEITVQEIESVTETEVTEDNFTAKFPVIKGAGGLASRSKTYIDQTVLEFKNQADAEVPKLREDFGKDNPTSNYSINITAKHLDNPKTETMVINVYTYTGGAHGSSYYKVFTVSKPDQNLVLLPEIIKQGEEEAFLKVVRQDLANWRPEGMVTSPLFTDLIKDLTMKDLENWSLDKENLTIYFSQYAVGPGVLGPIEFTVPIPSIRNFLVPEIL